MTSLYDYTQYYRNLYDLIENEQVTLEEVKEALDVIEDGIEVKVENISKLIKEFQAKSEVFKAEESRLATRRKTFENKVDSLKKYLLESLDAINKTKIEAGTFRVRKQKNRSSVNVYNEALLPEKYFKPQPPVVDKELLSEDIIKKGLSIAGAERKADSYHIRIE